MDDDRTLTQDLLIAAASGLFVAVFYFFAAGGLLASWAAGTAFFACFIVWVRAVGVPGYFGMVVLYGASGAIAGWVWWALANSTETKLEVIGGGAFLAALIGAAEAWREWKHDRAV